MNINFYHEIEKNPKPKDVGTIIFTARIFRGESDDPLTFTTECFAQEYLDDDHDECKSKEDLNVFLMYEELSNADIHYALTNLIDYVATCSESGEYSPGCALYVRLDFVPEDDSAKHRAPVREEGARAVVDENGNIKFVDVFPKESSSRL